MTMTEHDDRDPGGSIERAVQAHTQRHAWQDMAREHLSAHYRSGRATDDAALERLAAPAAPQKLPVAVAHLAHTDPIVVAWAHRLRHGTVDRTEALAGMVTDLASDLAAMREANTHLLHQQRWPSVPCPMERPADLDQEPNR